MPAVALVVREETPRVFIVLAGHEDANAIDFVWLQEHVLFPHDGEEEGTGGVHDCDVWEDPAPIVGLEGLDDAEEERVLGDGTHGIVGDSGGGSATNPGGVGEERI